MSIFREPLFVGYTGNDQKHIAYKRRTASDPCNEPMEYHRRYMAGLAVRKRAQRGRKANICNVLQLSKPDEVRQRNSDAMA